MNEEWTGVLRATVDLTTGHIAPFASVVERRMSDMTGLFGDDQAYRAAVARGNPVVYRVVTSMVPELPNQIGFATTTIEPGTVGQEFFMTRGHRHRVASAAEVYLCLGGHGGVLLSDGARPAWIEMTRGVIAHIGPGLAHRSVNVGAEPFRFLAVYPADSGTDYPAVAQSGLGSTVVRSGSGYSVLDVRGHELAARVG